MPRQAESERWDVRLRANLEAGLEGWGYVVARRPWLVIACMSAVAVGFASQLPRLEIDASTESLLRRQDPARVLYDEFRRQFGREEAIVIGLRPDEIFSFDFLEQLQTLHTALEDEVPHLEEVSSLINARLTRGEDEQLIVRELLAEWPESERDLTILRERALANPLYRNLLISEDGDYTAVIVRASAYSSSLGEADELAGFEDDPLNGSAEDVPFITGVETEEFVRAVLEVVERHRSDGLEIHVAGGPVMALRITDEMRQNMAVFSALAHVAIALLLGALFRRASAVLLPLVVVSLSVLSTFGGMAMLETPLSIPTQILPSFLLAVGIGATVHLLVVFYQRYDQGDAKEDALAFALGHSGLAIVMTALTTAGGLVSFAVAEIVPVAEMGIFAPIGILLGLAYCMMLLPALLIVSPLARRELAECVDRRALHGRRSGLFTRRHHTHQLDV
jgi:predicted RND superfamily exporter protein